MTKKNSSGNANSRFGGSRITWFGHASFRIESPQGKEIFIDPWIENPISSHKLADIGHADYVVITHGHADHMGNAIDLAKKTGATIVTNVEISHYLARQDIPDEQLIGMNIGGVYSSDEVQFIMVPSVHSSGIIEGNESIPGGIPAGLVLIMENGFTLYHTGDTDFFGDMRYIRELHHPELMLICIGDHYTMGPEKAAMSIGLIEPDHIIPMHYGTFPELTGTPDALVDFLSDDYKTKVIEMHPGDTIT